MEYGVLGVSLANSQQCTEKLEEKFVHVVLDYEMCLKSLIIDPEIGLEKKITLTAM